NPAYRMGANSSRPGNRHTRRWSGTWEESSEAPVTRNWPSGENAMALRPNHVLRGAPAQSPAGSHVCVFQRRQPSGIPVASQRPSGEKRHPSLASDNSRTFCHDSVSHNSAPEPCALASSLAVGEKDKLVPPPILATSFREAVSCT